MRITSSDFLAFKTWTDTRLPTLLPSGSDSKYSLVLARMCVYELMYD